LARLFTNTFLNIFLMKKHYLWPVLLAAHALLAGCNTDSKKTTTTTEQAPTATVEALASGITAENLPDPGIPGFSFPDSTHIQNWVNTNQADSVNLHGWGLWTALTTLTTQTYNGQALRVFETWQTKYELDSLMRVTTQKAPAALLARRGATPKRLPTTPAQFRRDPRNRALLSAHSVSHDTSSAPVLEVVSYSPSLASNILNQKLFWASSLNKVLASGRTTIPGFHASAASIKPMYEIVPGPSTSKGLYKMKVWTGAPHTSPSPAGFPQNNWSACVYVDIKNRVQPNKFQGSQLTCTTPSAANTYNLSDFIYYPLTAAEATSLNNAQHSKADRIAQAGDYAILVGMHITSNEINDWTWQTMWWSPNPDRGTDPSSPAVVAARPSQLTGAPRHYAMSISYQMIDPATATSNVGRSSYAYNPYLEAPFSASTFGTPANVVTNGITINNNFGIRTNCMSCHMQATFATTTAIGSKFTSLPYIGDTYVDPSMARFKGMLRTNFLWSISSFATHSGDTLR
jgi:hypothetical protein